MKRLVHSFLVATALASVPVAVHAQATTGTSTTLAFSQNLQVNVDGDKLDNEQYVYVGSSRCTKETNFVFKASGYVTGNSAINNLELWASAGTGTDCTQAGNRTKTATTTSQCWYIATVQAVTTTATTKDIPATEIFRGNADDESGDCPQVSNTPYTVYLVPLETPTESNPTMPPAALTGVQLLKATFNLSITTPLSPSNIKGSTGESELTVTWTKPSDFKNKSKFYVVYDTGIGEEDSTCADTQLEAEAQPPAEDDDTIFYSSTTAGTKGALKGLDAKGVMIGQYVAAAVVHRDQAGNDSNMSDVVCLQRVDVVTPLEQCDQDPNCKGDFDTCSLQPGADKSWSLAALALLALSISLFVRRRHV